MRRLEILLLALCAVLCASGSLAQEPARLALLIGNQAYAGKIQALKNPHNDIKTVGKLWRASASRSPRCRTPAADRC
jgi:hypothetical protein